jgi:hypothetical protein
LKVPEAEAKEVVAEVVKIAEKVDTVIDDKIETRFSWLKDVFATKEDIGSLKALIERNNTTILRWAFLFWVAQLSAAIAFIKYLK